MIITLDHCFTGVVYIITILTVEVIIAVEGQIQAMMGRIEVEEVITIQGLSPLTIQHRKEQNLGELKTNGTRNKRRKNIRVKVHP
jgi:hypothetical protein